MLKRQLSRIFEIFLISGRRYVTARHAQRAVLLTYYTLFSIVPLAALLFGIAKGFSLEKNLQEVINSRAANHRELLGYIHEFAERTLAEASGGVVAGIGVIALLWTVVWLINNIEKAFNVKVTNVNTLVTKPKDKRVGKYTGKTKTYKKAIVTLKDGESIEI